MLAVVVLIVLAAIFAPLITPYEEDYMDIGNELAGPSAEHWLGTDEFGRDVFTRIIYGSRVSLMVGLVAESIAVAIGLIVGAVAGFYGGKVDAVLSRIIEIFASFPHILFAIVVMFVYWARESSTCSSPSASSAGPDWPVSSARRLCSSSKRNMSKRRGPAAGAICRLSSATSFPTACRPGHRRRPGP